LPQAKEHLLKALALEPGNAKFLKKRATIMEAMAEHHRFDFMEIAREEMAWD